MIDSNFLNPNAQGAIGTGMTFTTTHTTGFFGVASGTILNGKTYYYPCHLCHDGTVNGVCRGHETLWSLQPHPQPCPTCGRCPTCGEK